LPIFSTLLFSLSLLCHAICCCHYAMPLFRH
jgi:hypothetical protein